MDMERTPENLRRFGTGLSIVLALLAGLSWHRGSPAAPGLLGAAAACALLARRVPAAFGLPFRLWMPAAAALARVNVRVLLGLFYFGALAPYGLLLRLLGKDLLEERFGPQTSYWKPRETGRGRERHESMF